MNVVTSLYVSYGLCTAYISVSQTVGRDPKVGREVGMLRFSANLNFFVTYL